MGGKWISGDDAWWQEVHKFEAGAEEDKRARLAKQAGVAPDSRDRAAMEGSRGRLHHRDN